MPDRYLRDGLLRSDRWNACSVDARDLYVRLVMIVDDYGCYDGRDGVVSSAAYFMGRTEPLPLPELHASGLILRYSNAGKLFLAITRWGETLRGRRRFPAPPVNNDLADLTYRGKYGQKVNFKNPVGTDAVSILLDLHGKPVMPQPPEWRCTFARPGDDVIRWLPLAAAQQTDDKTMARSDYKPQHAVTMEQRSDSTQSLHAVTSGEPPPPPARSDSMQQAVSSQRSVVSGQESATQQSATEIAPSPSMQSLQPPSTPTTPSNGKIKLNGEGGWDGLSAAQALRWQDMFADISIPDQLARAAAWLQAHPAERAVIERDGGEESFIVRWLLREVRPGHEPYKGEH